MKKIIIEIINDTLKRNGKWSRSSLTMFSAWLICSSMAIIDFLKTGIRYDVWIALLSVSLGVSITDSISKKINPQK